MRAFFAAVEVVEVEAEEVEGVVVDGDAGTVVGVVALACPPAAAFAASVTEDVEVVDREDPMRKDKKCELARRASIERRWPMKKKKRQSECILLFHFLQLLNLSGIQEQTSSPSPAPLSLFALCAPS